MSVYFLRHSTLIKIGFSSDLPARVRSIMCTIPGDVVFLGHMPGDREVEAHFHLRFEHSRFSGEWFAETPELLAVIDALADREMPAERRQVRSLHADSLAARRILAQRLRSAAILRFPTVSTNKQRVVLTAALLGWPARRVRSVWHAEQYFLSPAEHHALTRFTRIAHSQRTIELATSTEPTTIKASTGADAPKGD